MGTRIPSHKLSGGLYVSGRPENTTPRTATLSSRASAVPYTGGDVKKSGELGKMFEIPGASSQAPPKPSRPNSGPQTGPKIPTSSSQPSSGSVRSGPNSGQFGLRNSNSGPFQKKTSSGPMTPLQPTGLITSGPLGSSMGRRQPELSAGKAVYGPAVTDLGKGGGRMGFRVSKGVMWAVAVVMVMGVVVGAFLTVAVKNMVVGAAVAGVVVVAVAVVVWNWGWKRRGVLGYWKKYPNAELRGAVDGQYVKVTGVVTCGSIPLESSFQKVPRCVYSSTELYEYRGWGGESANPKHRFFSWGCRQAEKYVADFYISDFQTGLRALVKAGYGAKVSVFVEPTTVVDLTKDNRDSSPSFISWLSDHSLSSDDRIMRLKEGYIKEGSTVSVLGIVRRHDNVLMIVPPTEPVSTTCQWFKCLLPTYNEGLILLCNESQTADVIAV